MQRCKRKRGSFVPPSWGWAVIRFVVGGRIQYSPFGGWPVFDVCCGVTDTLSPFLGVDQVQPGWPSLTRSYSPPSWGVAQVAWCRTRLIVRFPLLGGGPENIRQHLWRVFPRLGGGPWQCEHGRPCIVFSPYMGVGHANCGPIDQALHFPPPWGLDRFT